MFRNNNIIFALILIIGILLIFSACERDKVIPREYPRLRTLDVNRISENGAQFRAEIVSMGNGEIINYGFLWSAILDPSIDNAEKVIISENLSSKKFSATITTTLEAEEVYYVRAFVEVSEYIVYGDKVEFLSLGSKAPDIYSYTPLTGSWGDTITVKGKNFSYLTESNTGILGEVDLECVYASDTIVKFTIPDIANDEHVQFAVEVSGNRAVAPEQFSYILPRIQSLSTSKASFGDTIMIVLYLLAL